MKKIIFSDYTRGLVFVCTALSKSQDLMLGVGPVVGYKIAGRELVPDFFVLCERK